MKIIHTVKTSVQRPSDLTNVIENEYAEDERVRERRRRQMGIGDPDIAEQLRKNRRRRRPTSGFAHRKKHKLPTEKTPRSVAEFWTSHGEMPEPDSTDMRQIEARDMAFAAYGNGVIDGKKAIEYKDWLLPIVPADPLDGQFGWNMVYNDFVNGKLSVDEIAHWWDILDVPKQAIDFGQPIARMSPKKKSRPSKRPPPPLATWGEPDPDAPEWDWRAARSMNWYKRAFK